MFSIIPPEGCEFVHCNKCQAPHIKNLQDPQDQTCLWCLINSEEETKDET